jgi:hypothetical protein
MPGLEGVNVGDTLLLLTRMGGAREKEQVPQEVTVVKVGRTLLHIPVSESSPEGKTLTYRIENGMRADNYGHTQVMTREAYEAEKSRDGLEESLRLHGIEVWRRGPKPIAVLEALLDVMERYERGEIK